MVSPSTPGTPFCYSFSKRFWYWLSLLTASFKSFSGKFILPAIKNMNKNHIEAYKKTSPRENRANRGMAEIIRKKPYLSHLLTEYYGIYKALQKLFVNLFGYFSSFFYYYARDSAFLHGITRFDRLSLC